MKRIKILALLICVSLDSCLYLRSYRPFARPVIAPPRINYPILKCSKSRIMDQKQWAFMRTTLLNHDVNQIGSIIDSEPLIIREREDGQPGIHKEFKVSRSEFLYTIRSAQYRRYSPGHIEVDSNTELYWDKLFFVTNFNAVDGFTSDFREPGEIWFYDKSEYERDRSVCDARNNCDKINLDQYRFEFTILYGRRNGYFVIQGLDYMVFHSDGF